MVDVPPQMEHWAELLPETGMQNHRIIRVLPKVHFQLSCWDSSLKVGCALRAAIPFVRVVVFC